MRHSPAEVKKRLLSALDEDSNVIDMAVVLDVVSILEQLPISREALETTRLGKHINDLRKKTQDPALAKRAKALVRRWRDMIIPASAEAPAAVTVPVQPQSKKASPPAVSPRSYPSSANTSPCLSRSTTPGLSKLSPGLSRGVTLQPISPVATTRPAGSSPTPEQAPDKADVANKRKRKADPADEEHEKRPEKRQRYNGVPNIDECSRDSISGEINADLPAATEVATPAAKKRRPRSAVGAPTFDDLSEKLASVARTPRVKTTRELLSDLAERSGDSALARRASQFPQQETPPPVRRTPLPPPPQHELSRNKSAHMEKFLNSQGNGRRRGRPPISRPVPSGNGAAAPIETIDLEPDDDEVPPPTPATETPVVAKEEPEAAAPSKPWPTEAEILARLPPLNEADIVWSDEETDTAVAPTTKPVPLDPAKLSSQHLENINGNTNHEGVFKEWNEVVTASIREGEVLPMLPYVMID